MLYCFVGTLFFFFLFLFRNLIMRFWLAEDIQNFEREGEINTVVVGLGFEGEDSISESESLGWS